MLSRSIFGICVFIGILLFGLCLLLAWKQGWIVNIINLRDPILVWCRANPVALFMAIALLPGFAFPVAPLLILAGVVWGANIQSCGLALAAVIINITWSHLLAAGIGRKIIQKLLGKYWEAWSKKIDSSGLATHLHLTHHSGNSTLRSKLPSRLVRCAALRLTIDRRSHHGTLRVWLCSHWWSDF